MYDETRLVLQYLRRAEFPAMKQDLLRLAKLYTDEGRALRWLEQLPGRCYSNLHDLISENPYRLTNGHDRVYSRFGVSGGAARSAPATKVGAIVGRLRH